MNHEVRFLPDGKRSEIQEGATIMSAALQGDIDIATLCNGKGYCGKCLVEALEGRLGAETESEKKRIPSDKLSKGFRLACQARVMGDVTVRIPSQSRVGKQRLVIMGKEPPVKINPNLEKVFIEMDQPTLSDPRADDERLLSALSARGFTDLKLDYAVAQSLSVLLRSAGWKVTVAVLGKSEIVGIQPGDTRKASFGVAVDIGTTKLAVFIVDLTDGTLIFADGMMNPQIRFGEDVISRINYASQVEKGLKDLKDTIIAGINELIGKGVKETAIDENDLYELIAVGNTAMHHLFLGTSCKSLGFSPYPASIGRPFNVKAREVGVAINGSGNVHMLPNVAGFVGADAIADVLASRLHEKDGITLLMDVGTNTEVMLGNRDCIWSCSTASGPAFEGAHIKCGMRAASGAIENVRISPQFDVTFRTVDDSKARGICGSGIIDAVAEALNSGLISTSGRMVPLKNIRMRGEGASREFVLVPKEDTSSGKEDIVLTLGDVREIQKAKAAMYAGYSTLMRIGGYRKEDLSEIIIAGAFGNYIDPNSARTIGMIPEVPLDRITFLGNTAGSGARMCLKSMDSRLEAGEIGKKMKYVELAAETIFQEEYINAMYMPNSSLEDFPQVVKGIRGPKEVKHYRR